MTDDGTEKAPARILIVEDEAILAEDLGLSLKNLGYVVKGKVSTGEEAVKLAETLRPDLILMDIKLQGDIDGIEAADQIRKRLDIPVIYLTGYAEKDVLERAKKTEPYGYLGKPISLSELRSTIETALYKHGADKRVRESEERFRKVFEQGPIGVGLVGTDGRFLVANSQLCQMLGYTEDELTRLTFVDITHPDHVTQDLEAIRRLYAGEIPYYKAEKRYIKKDGDIRWGNLTAAAIRDAGGKLLYTLPMIEDITDRKKAEAALAKAEELQRTILSTSPVGIGLSVDRKMVWVNDAWKEMFGLSPNDANGLTINARAVYPTQEEFERVGKILYEGLEAGQVNETDATMIRKDGTIFDVHIAMKAVDPSDPSRGTLAAITDITERKKAEEQVRASLREKDVLLREIHHRVKNNLAVIQSLLRIQSHHVQNEEAYRILEETQHRIRSMALGHELLYQSENLSSINISQYMGKLLSQLIASFSIVGKRIEIRKEIEEVPLSIDVGVPLGFILTELISNCYQHAFPEGRRGEI